MNALRSLAAAIAAVHCTAGLHAQLQGCVADPAPTGLHVSPSDSFSTIGEYAFAHSSTRMQANPTQDKIAAGLFWNPAGSFGTGIPRAYGAFSSAIVVNNPDPGRAVAVEIRFFDPAGIQLGAAIPVVIPADGTHMMDASPLGQNGGTGVGSARIQVTTPGSLGIVGATLHYFDSIAVPGWGTAKDPDFTVNPVSGALSAGPGEGSYQQLHSDDGLVSLTDPAGALYAGPFRFTNVSKSDFDNGSAPILAIANPNDVPMTADLLVFHPSPVHGPILVQSELLSFAPRGMVVYDKLWVAMNQLSAAFNGDYDFDLAVLVLPRGAAKPGKPVRNLVGDALVIDAFGDDESGEANRNLNLSRRLRMVSTAMATDPGLLGVELRGCDLTRIAETDDALPFIDTRVHVMNASSVGSGPITVEYFDHFGASLGLDTIPGGLEAAEALHIGFGETNTPNFPSQVFNGSIRVRGACGQPNPPRLIGWMRREIGPTPAGWPANYQYRKAYGEELEGANAFEHGIGGIPISGSIYATLPGTAPGFNLGRYVMPIVRTWATSTPPYWPGYSTFANLDEQANSTPGNTGPHVYRFFENNGTDATSQPPPILAMPFGGSSLAFEDTDPAGPLSLIFTNSGTGSARVDFAPFARVVGINVLGDPFREYGIGDFAIGGLGPTGIRPPDRKPVIVEESAETAE